jgi:type III pantothenate kinase
MNWLIDLGNSRLKCAPLLDDRRGDVRAFAHRDGGIDLDGLRAMVGEADPGASAWLASVAPAALGDATAALLSAQGYVVKIVRSLPRCRRLRIAYDEPGHMGVDRFLSLLAASDREDGPWLLVSIGSAVTVDLLADDGQHLGGTIAPSAAHMREALGQRFAALDHEPGRAVDFADDTADAVSSGTCGAVLGLIERSRRLAEARHGLAPKVILSGGDAEAIATSLPFPTEQSAWLVLDGLALLAQDELAQSGEG